MNVGVRIPTKVDTELPDRPFGLRHYLNFLWRNWLFIASMTAFAFLVGVIYLVRATPLYTAATQVLLEQGEKPAGLDNAGSDRRFNSYSGYGYMENQIAIVKSDSLLRRVVIKELAPPKTTQDDGQNKDNPAAAERAI